MAGEVHALSVWAGGLWHAEVGHLIGPDVLLPVPSSLTDTAVQDGALVLVDQAGRIGILEDPRGSIRHFGGQRQWVQRVTPSPVGRFVASGGWDDDAWIWDLSTEPPTGRPLRGHSDAVVALGWSADGRVLYTGDHGGEVRRWAEDLPLAPDALRTWVGARVAELRPDDRP
ncbi:MAG: hypothetical protein H6736_00425 [Alphaproteobacteria bacterium]|nr:hypothetical protein [Alphaproteobacteria bacterium]